MPSIRKSLLQFLFSGSFMKRWNDKLRPMELVEVDKQAHKMIVAWVLYQLNSNNLSQKDTIDLGEKIIEGGIFDYLYRLIITDIKPPIFYQIKSNPAHYQQLTQWVLEQVGPRMQPLGSDLWDRFESYVREPEASDMARRILNAAHLFASSWEFSLIKGLNLWDEEMEEIEESFEKGLKEHTALLGVQDMLDGPSTAIGRFSYLCGQLRFQKRWSQTPRIPETSVLGHMFIVASYGFFFSLAIKACPQRRINNFFSGLFHDLPELLTRDIISPVKKSVQQISDLIKEYEDQETRKRVFNILDEGGHKALSERLGYFLGMDVGSEFSSSIRVDGQAREVTWEQLQTTYNKNSFDPKDGFMLKICDRLAAFIEAYTAINNGIRTSQLQEAMLRIKTMYSNISLGEGLHIGALLADFD